MTQRDRLRVGRFWELFAAVRPRTERFVRQTISPQYSSELGFATERNIRRARSRPGSSGLSSLTVSDRSFFGQVALGPPGAPFFFLCETAISLAAD